MDRSKKMVFRTMLSGLFKRYKTGMFANVCHVCHVANIVQALRIRDVCQSWPMFANTFCTQNLGWPRRIRDLQGDRARFECRESNECWMPRGMSSEPLRLKPPLRWERAKRAAHKFTGTGVLLRNRLVFAAFHLFFPSRIKGWRHGHSPHNTHSQSMAFASFTVALWSVSDCRVLARTTGDRIPADA